MYTHQTWSSTWAPSAEKTFFTKSIPAEEIHICLHYKRPIIGVYLRQSLAFDRPTVVRWFGLNSDLINRRISAVLPTPESPRRSTLYVTSTAARGSPARLPFPVFFSLVRSIFSSPSLLSSTILVCEDPLAYGSVPADGSIRALERLSSFHGNTHLKLSTFALKANALSLSSVMIW